MLKIEINTKMTLEVCHNYVLESLGLFRTSSGLKSLVLMRSSFLRVNYLSKRCGAPLRNKIHKYIHVYIYIYALVALVRATLGGILSGEGSVL